MSRIVQANDETGRWDVLDESGWLADFESESNAKEFAAAPELLEACSAFESLMTRYLVIGKAQHEVEALVEQTRNALMKALGEKQ